MLPHMAKNLPSLLTTQLRDLKVNVWQKSAAIFTSMWIGEKNSDPEEGKLGSALRSHVGSVWKHVLQVSMASVI